MSFTIQDFKKHGYLETQALRRRWWTDVRRDCAPIDKIRELGLDAVLPMLNGDTFDVSYAWDLKNPDLNLLVPEIFRERTIADSRFATQIREFMANKRQPFAIFTGPVGTGKTTTAWALLAEYLSQNQSLAVELVKWRVLLATFSESEAFDDDARARLRDWERSDVFVLNDFGKARMTTDTRFDLLGELLDDRMERGVKTVLTTNLTVKGIKDLAGDRIHDRLKDALVLVFDGPSFRGGMGQTFKASDMPE